MFKKHFNKYIYLLQIIIMITLFYLSIYYVQITVFNRDFLVYYPVMYCLRVFAIRLLRCNYDDTAAVLFTT